MMRFILAFLIAFSMSDCHSQSLDPRARIEIEATSNNQLKLFESLKTYGERNGFDVFTSDRVPKEGRFVSQLYLRRSDGVRVTMDNFLDINILTVAFYSERSNADWQSVKKDWLHEAREKLNGSHSIFREEKGGSVIGK